MLPHQRRGDRPDIPDQGGLLRLLQGQGKVELNAYDVFGDGQLSETFRGTLDTTEKDVLLPVLQDKTDAVIFAADGVRFSFETQDPQTAVPADLPKLASFAGNKNMTNFYAGKDEVKHAILGSCAHNQGNK